MVMLRFSSTKYYCLQVGFSYVMAMLLSNSALLFINYPSQVIVKSCKMIPVMAVSVLVRGITYPLSAYVRVAMVTFGIACFAYIECLYLGLVQLTTTVSGIS